MWLFSEKKILIPVPLLYALAVVAVIYRKHSLKSVGRRNRRLAVH